MILVHKIGRPPLAVLILIPFLLSTSGKTGAWMSRPNQAAAASSSDWRFGVIESYEDPAAAGQLGAAWTRVTFHWAEVQAGGTGSWTPRVTDEQINQEINAGRLVVGLLIGIPGWALDSNGLPQGLWSPHNDPGNRWANFVREAVQRYQGRINHWIIWNEPDIRSGAIAHTWSGTVNDFFQLQRTAYLVAKEANPSSVIHLSAFTYWADANTGSEQYMARLLDQIATDPAAAEHNYYFDVATAHLYFQTSQVFDLLQFFLGLMRQRGMMQPIWLVETNLPPYDDPSWPVANPFLAATLEEQAAFMPQVMATALAAGAQRLAIYKLKDTASDRAANPEPFGLIRLDGGRRPAFSTYQIGIQYLAGMTGARRERWDSVGQIRISQASRTTTVLFSRLPTAQRARVEATAPSAILVDMWGRIQTVAAADGSFTIDLPGAPCTQSVGEYCMVGGTTYYLVQTTDGSDLPGAPAATPTPTATETATVTPRPTLTATMKPSKTPTSTPSPTPSPTPSLSPTVTSSPTPDGRSSATAQTTTSAASAGAALASGLDQETPTALPRPNVPSEAAEDPATLSYWFIAGGLLLGVALIAATAVRRRRAE